MKLHTDDDVLLELSAVIDDRGPPGDNCSTWHGGQAYEGREAEETLSNRRWREGVGGGEDTKRCG